MHQLPCSSWSTYAAGSTHACTGWYHRPGHFTHSPSTPLCPCARRQPSGEPCLAAILQTAAEIGDALRELHRRDVVHGDLTAYNVLLSSRAPRAVAAGRGFVAKVGVRWV